MEDFSLFYDQLVSSQSWLFQKKLNDSPECLCKINLKLTYMIVYFLKTCV